MIVSKCPSCSDPVTVPDVSRSARVRCPLCQEEYTIADVLDGCPPLLELLDASSDDESGYGAPDYDLEPEAKGGSFSFEESSSPTLAATATTTAKAPSRPAARRPRRKPRNPVIEIAKVVVGGLVGLCIAQMILWWLPFNLDVNQRDPASIGRNIGANVPWLAWLVPEQVRGVTTASEEPDDNSPFAAKNFDQKSDDTNQTNNPPPRNQGNPANQGRSGQPGGNRGNRGNGSGNRDNGEGGDDGGNDSGQETSGPTTFDPGNPLNNLPEVPTATSNVTPPSDAPNSGFQLAGRAPPENLADAIRAAREANAAYDSDANATTGNSLYEALAKIGTTLREVEANDLKDLAPYSRELHGLLGSLGPGKIPGIATTAGKRLDDQGRASDGIILAGTVTEIQPIQGDYYRSRIKLGDTAGKTIDVLGWKKPQPAFEVGAKVIVAGVIVDDPAERLINYSGSDEQIVCGLYSHVIDEDSQ